MALSSSSAPITCNSQCCIAAATCLPLLKFSAACCFTQSVRQLKYGSRPAAKHQLNTAARAAGQQYSQSSHFLAEDLHSLHDTSDSQNASPNSYTSMHADPLSFWENHPGILHQHLHPESAAAYQHHNELEVKADGDDGDDGFLLAEMQLLLNAACDRAEMHAILAQQRDNWNKLFQRTLTATSLTACILSGLAGAGPGISHSLSFSLPALLLNGAGAAMMAIINQFQPSQLAEEQRTAARLFRKLASDVKYAASVPSHLRQQTSSFLRDCKRRLEALDKAFPMPLTPGGLEKFPAKVVPPVLIQPLIPNNTISQDHVAAMGNINGWDKQLTDELQHVASLLHCSDVPKYTGWAQNLVKVNKCLAIVAPLSAACAALLNALMILSTNTNVLPFHLLSTWAATCSVLAAFAGSFSSDMQLGMVFELYRNSAGYYADVEVSIKNMLDMPVQHREHGALFRQRIAYQLGRWPGITTPTSSNTPLVPADAKEAGTLF